MWLYICSSLLWRAVLQNISDYQSRTAALCDPKLFIFSATNKWNCLLVFDLTQTEHVQALRVHWQWPMKFLLWPCAWGKSLKIPALPSVITSSFRSRVFCKKQQGPTECNQNNLLSPFLALCAPEMDFSCIWMSQGVHDVMRKWRGHWELYLGEIIWGRSIFKEKESYFKCPESI